MDWYKELWSRIGGRPWTFIYRDIWHKYEWFPQMQWLFTGAVAYLFLGWKGLLFSIAVYTYGYINGHFFWGTKWIRGQKGNGRDNT